MNKSQLTVSVIQPEVALITLNRIEKRNALSVALMEELIQELQKLEKDPKVRIVILSGAGPTFCAGFDLQEALDPVLIETTAQHVARLLTAIYTTPLVMIAAVQGNAIAGGAGIVAACDYALMVQDARIGFPETRRGLIAAQVSTLLCRQMRMRDVRELLLLGEPVDAHRAYLMGLINQVVPPEELMARALEVANAALKGAPEAVRQTKQLLNNLYPTPFSDDLHKALTVHHSKRRCDEAKEGIAAFLEKRPPQW